MPPIAIDLEAPAAPISAALLDLAPLELRNLRADRYQGENVSIPLSAFAAADREIVLQVYTWINELLGILGKEASATVAVGEIRRFLGRAGLDHMRSNLRVLGRATLDGDQPDRAIGKAIHDIRGGALTALFMRLELFGEGAMAKRDRRALFMLTRDHGKIMRSAIADLDPDRRKRNLAPQSHHVSLLTEKWHDAIVGRSFGREAIRLGIDCRFDGTVTECCLESAAIDRVFYNLVANALRHTANERLELSIFEVPRSPGSNLRFVLRNSLGEADEKRLLELANAGEGATSLGRIFQSGVSTTGSGLGLSIVADLVTQAFGIASEERALALGYFGACLLEGKFTVWFHWPIARDGLGNVVSKDATEEIPRDLGENGE